MHMAPRPKLKVSEEGDAKGLRLGRAEGAAYGRTLKHMTGDVAEAGDAVRHGDYIIGYAVEKAEGMYMPGRTGRLKWMEPKAANAHIEVSVRDAADGRFIPVLDVTVTVTNSGGKKIGKHKEPLVWHPYLYHYGRNWRLPGDGRYSLRIQFPAPKFHRHEERQAHEQGRRCHVSQREDRNRQGLNCPVCKSKFNRARNPRNPDRVYVP
jgi:hypothetical protein